jgi:hypothetical protein
MVAAAVRFFIRMGDDPLPIRQSFFHSSKTAARGPAPLSGEAAVDRTGDADDIAGGVAAEPEHRRADFLGPSEPAQRETGQMALTRAPSGEYCNATLLALTDQPCLVAW